MMMLQLEVPVIEKIVLKLKKKIKKEILVLCAENWLQKVAKKVIFLVIKQVVEKNRYKIII